MCAQEGARFCAGAGRAALPRLPIAGACPDLAFPPPAPPPPSPCSSNVVEKCLKLGGAGLNEQRDAVVAELMTSPNLARLLQVRACMRVGGGGVGVGGGGLCVGACL